jgi:sec-independent protein translocase protein TatA
MFGDLFTGPHMLFLAVIVLVLFGGKKLPELGKGLGEGLRGFKDGMKGMTEEDSAAAVAAEKKKEAEEKAYQEMKLAQDAKAAAEARLAAEKAGASAHLVTPKPEEVAR